MSHATACCVGERYCGHCDVLLGFEGLHVVRVERGPDQLVIDVETDASQVAGCPSCGVIAHRHGRVKVILIDAPCFATAVRLRWLKRRWLCPEPECELRTFVEQDSGIALPRGVLTARAARWAITQMRRENASVQGLARQLGCAWATLWRAVKPVLEAAAADEGRYLGVARLGVDEHIWHHVSTKPVHLGGKGPKEFTAMVDLTRDTDGKTRARLLDLIPGRSGKAYKDWLEARGESFRAGVKVATLDPFHGYKNAIDDKLEDATAVLDAFHVVKLGIAVVDEVRCRVQTETKGHRGRKDDPLYRIRNTLRAAQERLTERQRQRLENVFTAHERHIEVEVAWRCAQQLRSVYHQKHPAKGKAIAEKIIATFPTCPIPEVARLGRTLKRWRDAFLGYFATSGANNGGTEAINGLIELHRRIARGFRNPDNYRLRMLLTGGGLNT